MNLFIKYCVSKSYLQSGMRGISPKILCFCVLGGPRFFHPVSVTILFVLLDLPLLCSCLRCWFLQNTFHSFQDQPVSSQVQSMGATGLTFGKWEVGRRLVFLLFSTCFRLHLLPWLHKPCGFNFCQSATAAPSQLPAHTIHCGPRSCQVVSGNPPAPSVPPALGMVPAFCFSHLWAVSFLLFVFSALQLLCKYFSVLNSLHLMTWHGLCLSAWTLTSVARHATCSQWHFQYSVTRGYDSNIFLHNTPFTSISMLLCCILCPWN